MHSKVTEQFCLSENNPQQLSSELSQILVIQNQYFIMTSNLICLFYPYSSFFSNTLCNIHCNKGIKKIRVKKIIVQDSLPLTLWGNSDHHPPPPPPTRTRPSQAKESRVTWSGYFSPWVWSGQWVEDMKPGQSTHPSPLPLTLWQDKHL